MGNILLDKRDSKRRKIKRLEAQGKTYEYSRYYARTAKTGIEWICDFETLTANTQHFKKTNDTQIILWVARRRDAVDDNKTLNYYEYKPETNKLNGSRKRQDVYEKHDFICGVDGDSFIDFVLNSPKTTTFYFHNLKYDGTFIIPLLNKAKNITQVHYKLVDNGMLLEGYETPSTLKTNYWDIFRQTSKIFKIMLRKRGKSRNITITFRCTYLMLSSSVKALGNALGSETFNNKPLKKFLEEENNVAANFYDVEPVKEIKDLPIEYFEYCCRDVEIVRRSVNVFHDLFNQELPTILKEKEHREEHNKRQKEKGNTKALYKGDLNIWGMGVSIAGLMRKLLNEIYIPHYQYNTKDFKPDKQYRHLKNYYYGNFSRVDKDTHEFFTTKHDLYENNTITGGAKIFRGGFTQFNPKYQNVKSMEDVGDCAKWDISSAYPYQMTKYLPFGKLIDHDDFKEYYKDLKPFEYYEFLIIPIKKVEPKEIAKMCATLPNIGRAKTENNKFFRYINTVQENITLALVKQEWDELQHWYKFTIDEELETQKYYMLAAPFLHGIATELYNEKNRFSKEGKTALKQCVKIAINSVYGSLGIRRDFDSLVYGSKELAEHLFKTEPVSIKCDKAGKELDVTYRHCCTYIDTNYSAIKINENKENNDCWNIAAASVITALERTYLFKTIRRVGPKYFAYADTDSIVFANMSKEARETMEKIEKGEITIENEQPLASGLGMWECEYRNIKGFKVHKAKEYIQKLEDDTICFKGAGFVLDNERIKGLFYMTLKEREQLTNEQIQQYYPNEILTDDFCNKIRRGDTLIINGSVITQSCNSGDIIIKKDKWTSYGEI